MKAVRILIADDSDLVRRAIRRLLDQQPNISVTGEARSFPELLRMLKESPPEVILMDVRMPGRDQASSEAIKAQMNGSCLLAMSVWNDRETVTIAQEYGAFRLLDKSELASVLVPAIERAIQQTKNALSNGRDQPRFAWSSTRP